MKECYIPSPVSSPYEKSLYKLATSSRKCDSIWTCYCPFCKTYHFRHIENKSLYINADFGCPVTKQMIMGWSLLAYQSIKEKKERKRN